MTDFYIFIYVLTAIELLNLFLSRLEINLLSEINLFFLLTSGMQEIVENVQ